jgi:uncharacterized phiE125 gp8 family phage protein
MNPVLVTGPDHEPVSLDDMKNHLRVDIADDDELIMAYMLTARRTCERIARKKFVTQTWDLWADGFIGSTKWKLPKSMSPLQSVTHIKHYDRADGDTTINAANYIVDTYSQPAKIVLKTGQTWPGDILREVNGVNIQVVVGFGDDADVPEEIKQALKLLVGHFYENREDLIVGSQVHEVPMGVKNLLWLDRNMVF